MSSAVPHPETELQTAESCGTDPSSAAPLPANKDRLRPCSIVGWSCHKYDFCRDKHVLFASRQNTSFVATNSDIHNFVATKVLSRQAYFCRDKHVFVVANLPFVATKICLSREKNVYCRDESLLVAAKVLPRQNHVCRDVFVTSENL